MNLLLEQLKQPTEIDTPFYIIKLLVIRKQNLIVRSYFVHHFRSVYYSLNLIVYKFKELTVNY